MPTAASNTYTGAGVLPMFPNLPSVSLPVKLQPNITYPKGTVIAELTATPGLYGPYADAGGGGLGVAKAILQYDCVTDASSNISFVTSGTAGGQFGETFKTAPAWFSGTFKTTELVGFDAAALADLEGTIMYGSIADGVLKF